jgi:hypothetical protein
MGNQQLNKFRKLAKKGKVPRLSRANENEILDWLHKTAKRNLFGNGHWPADDKTKLIYWFLFKRCLSISLSGHGWYHTQFAREIDLDSLAAFIGVDLESCLTAFDWDKVGEAELEDLIEAILEGADEDQELTKRYLRGAYIRYCAARGISPFQLTQ